MHILTNADLILYRLQIIEDDYAFGFADETYQVSIKLDKDNQCTATKGG